MKATLVHFKSTLEYPFTSECLAESNTYYIYGNKPHSSYLFFGILYLEVCAASKTQGHDMIVPKFQARFLGNVSTDF